VKPAARMREGRSTCRAFVGKLQRESELRKTTADPSCEPVSTLVCMYCIPQTKSCKQLRGTVVPSVFNAPVGHYLITFVF
jgi:hypothetical protein